MMERKRTYWMLTKLMLLLALLAGGTVWLFAFQSVGFQMFEAGVVTGGVPSTNLQLRHDILIQGSAVTRQIIILGETAGELPPTIPAYSSRLTTASDFGPAPDRRIRVRIRYRFVPSLDPLATAGIPEEELPIIEGGEPTNFAFEIPSSSVTVGFLQYRIVAERLAYIGGVLVPQGQVTLPPTTSTDPEPFVNVGVQANASAQFGPEGGRFTLVDANPADGQTEINIPAGLFPGLTSISIDEVPVNGSITGGPSPINPIFPGGLVNPVRVYNLTADAPLRGILSLTLLYPDFIYPGGPDGTIDGTNIPVRNLSIFWWDGFVWRRLGGVINTNNNTISARISKLGFIAIAAASPLSAEDRRPLERIITPNGDGINDTLLFTFGDLSENVKVEIFDVTGHRVRTILSQSTMQWDGRDDNGSVVESGVYIYQYQVDGNQVSGVAAVAK